MPGSAFVFSDSPDGRTWLKPDSVSQRYARMCSRLGWNMNFHQLRHYSATGLISSGVDVTTVAGRLDGSGGSTTLKFYAPGSRKPTSAPPARSQHGCRRFRRLSQDGGLKAAPSNVENEKASPYLRIAFDLRGAITCGALKPGDKLPPVADLAARYGVSFGTAQRAVAQLRSEGPHHSEPGATAGARRSHEGHTRQRHAVRLLPARCCVVAGCEDRSLK